MRPLTVLFSSAALLLITGAAALAQEDFEIDLFRPRLDVTVERFADREFVAFQGEEFSTGSLALDANIPIGPVHADLKGKVLGYQIFASAALSRTDADLTFLPREHRLNAGRLAISGLLLGSSKNLYWLSAGASAAEDEDLDDSLEARLTAVFAGTHRFSRRTTLLYGAFYSHQFGRGLALPLVGAHWRLGDRWTLAGILPVSVLARYRVNDDLFVRLRLGATGDRFRFDNSDGAILGGSEIVHFRLVETQTSGGIEWRASSHVSLLADAGITRARRFKFTDEDDEDAERFDDETDPGGFVRMTVRINFGKTLLDELKP